MFSVSKGHNFKTRQSRVTVLTNLYNPGLKVSILYPLSFVNHFAEGKRSGYQLTDLQPAYA